MDSYSLFLFVRLHFFLLTPTDYIAEQVIRIYVSLSNLLTVSWGIKFYSFWVKWQSWFVIPGRKKNVTDEGLWRIFPHDASLSSFSLPLFNKKWNFYFPFSALKNFLNEQSISRDAHVLCGRQEAPTFFFSPTRGSRTELGRDALYPQKPILDNPTHTHIYYRKKSNKRNIYIGKSIAIMLLYLWKMAVCVSTDRTPCRVQSLCKLIGFRGGFTDRWWPIFQWHYVPSP